MTIDKACVECIINQSAKVAKAISADKKLSRKLTLHVEKLSKDFSYEDSPPEIASYVYEDMARIAHKYDLYDEVKEASTKKALSFVPSLQKKLSTCKDKLLCATKIAVAGNVIDLAAEVEFDLSNEMEHIFDTEFAHNDYVIFKEKLQKAKEVLVIGDNVGEHIFDRMFVKTVKELYPDIALFYAVRGNPIINDVTIKEADEAGFDEICKIVDTGVNTPGFTYDRANTYSKELFDRVDIVIAKGMGNYECMSPSHREGICFLLKVKCQVVASSLNREVGDIVCKVV